jgi:hypothetical protein
MLDELVNWAKGEMQRIEAEYARNMDERRLARNAAARQRYVRRKAKVGRACIEYEPREGCTCYQHPPCRWCESGANTTAARPGESSSTHLKVG